MHQSKRQMTTGLNMSGLHISLMEQNDIQQCAKVLSIAMLNNPHHIGVFLSNGEKERLEIENMFFELLNILPGYVFLAKDKEKIIGVMRMKSCVGKVNEDPDIFEDENDIDWRKSIWFKEWAKHDPAEQHWHLGPIGVLPTHQGLGIGSILMERFCNEVDACKAKAYLETDLDKNVGFYEKFGFKVVSESEIFGVKNRYMLRDIQP
jgi:ribosomal protein S18 acetylase RimI-like enzyme